MRIDHSIEPPKTMPVEIICSYCRALIRVEEWPIYTNTDSIKKPTEPVKSHGMCLPCLEKFKAAEGL